MTEDLHSRLLRLLATFKMRKPADEHQVVTLESSLGAPLPLEYREFVAITNGGLGSIGPLAYADLWPVDELLERNLLYGVAEFESDLLVFGSDGGSEAFAFDMRSSWQIIVVPISGFDRADVLFSTATFVEFLEHLARFGVQSIDTGIN